MNDRTTHFIAPISHPRLPSSVGFLVSGTQRHENTSVLIHEQPLSLISSHHILNGWFSSSLKRTSVTWFTTTTTSNTSSHLNPRVTGTSSRFSRTLKLKLPRRKRRTTQKTNSPWKKRWHYSTEELGGSTSLNTFSYWTNITPPTPASSRV